MTESVSFAWLVLGVVVVIGIELLRRADNRKMNSHGGKARLEAVGNKRIGNVFAVPSQEESHAVNARSSEMKGVAPRQNGENIPFDQFGGKCRDLLVKVENCQP